MRYTSNIEEAADLLGDGESVTLSKGNYVLTEELKLVSNGQKFLGSNSVIESRVGAAISTPTNSVLKNIEISDLTLKKDINTQSIGILINGIWHSTLSNLVLDGFDCGLSILAKVNQSTYYSIFKNVKCSFSKYGFFFITVDIDKEPPRINNNTFEQCIANFNQTGFYVNGSVACNFISCGAEKNELNGFEIKQCTATMLNSGYFESNKCDIFLGESCINTSILNTRLFSKKRIDGPSLGSNGDNYMIAAAEYERSSKNNYNNWMQRSHINDLSCQVLSFDDVTLSRNSQNTLALGPNDDILLSGNWRGGRLRLKDRYLWVDANGNLRSKNGQPKNDLDGKIL
jgi:hypothetical protein